MGKFQKAIESVTDGATQKLPSEGNSNDITMNDVSSQPVSDDYFSAPSTSNNSTRIKSNVYNYFSAPSTSNNSTRIKFNVYNENRDSSYSFSLSENDTVGKLTYILRIQIFVAMHLSTKINSMLQGT